jgi:membrane fusion protein (multidrug efflux system)
MMALGLTLGGCDRAAPPPPAAVQPAEVDAETLALVDVPMTPSFIARVRSAHDVDIVARVSGFLERIAYTEGQKVKPGDVLFVIDKKPLQAQRDSAAAQLESFRAELWTAKASLDRIRPLAQKRAASQSDLDNATGRYKAAEAAVAEAGARLKKAELELGYATIHSPITGVAGQALVREGAYLSASGAGAKLSHVVQLDPIWVEFSVTQNQFARMQDDIASGRVVSPPASEYTIEVELADGKNYPRTGRFTYADRTLDPQTGTFLVRVELPNPEEALLPGMFVRAWIKGAVRPRAIRVPQKAVQQTANGHIVYLVNARSEAEIRPVVMGPWIGPDWIVEQGLQAGEQVIVDGFQRLAPGAPVRLATAKTPPAPAPAAATR